MSAPAISCSVETSRLGGGAPRHDELLEGGSSYEQTADSPTIRAESTAGMGTAPAALAMLESAAPKQAAPNLGDLVEDALHQAKTLVQAEFSLARTELKGELKQALSSALLLGAGAMCLQAALVTLGVLLVLALGVGVASVFVVIGLLVIAAALLAVGVRSMQGRKLPRTTDRLASDAKQVLETVK
jgi:Flp pilus assembly protein TadB